MDSLFIKQERLLAQTSTRIIRIADLPDSFILADNMEFRHRQETTAVDRGINLLKKTRTSFFKNKKAGIQLAAGYRFSFIFTDQEISNEA